MNNVLSYFCHVTHLCAHNDLNHTGLKSLCAAGGGLAENGWMDAELYAENIIAFIKAALFMVVA